MTYWQIFLTKIVSFPSRQVGLELSFSYCLFASAHIHYCIAMPSSNPPTRQSVASDVLAASLPYHSTIKPAWHLITSSKLGGKNNITKEEKLCTIISIDLKNIPISITYGLCLIEKPEKKSSIKFDHMRKHLIFSRLDCRRFEEKAQ